MTREEWLTKASEELAPMLRAAGVESVPCYISVGFPRGARGRRRAIGQCWDGAQSTDGKPHVFVCPTQGAERALDILLHEMIHASVGCKAGHKREFSSVAKAVGLVKPWTATTPGPELTIKLQEIAARLGEYPHAVLNVASRPKVGSRLRLFECECVPPLKARFGHDHVNVTCDDCGASFKRQE